MNGWFHAPPAVVFVVTYCAKKAATTTAFHMTFFGFCAMRGHSTAKSTKGDRLQPQPPKDARVRLLSGVVLQVPTLALNNFDVINGQQLNATSQAEILSLWECEKYFWKFQNISDLKWLAAVSKAHYNFN